MRVVRVRMPHGEKRMGVVVDDEVVLLRESKYGSERGYVVLFREATRKGLQVTEFLQRIIAGDRRLKRISYAEVEKGGGRGCSFPSHLLLGPSLHLPLSRYRP
jgi:hypothetical protein